MTGPDMIIAAAARIADEVLFPAAALIDAGEPIPAAHLGLLASEGFYGLAGPAEAGGLDLPFQQACRVIEIMAGGCLAPTGDQAAAVRLADRQPGRCLTQLAAPPPFRDSARTRQNRACARTSRGRGARRRPARACRRRGGRAR
ncbi:MAG TPA: acyl-CoA dehydrogenase family protein [Streptosporangiaceae bacterium]